MTGGVRSSRSKQTLAEARSTLIVQRVFKDHETTDDVDGWLESLIDRTTVLRRLGGADSIVIVQPNSEAYGRVEVRCNVEYGPVFGCWESDIQSQLEAMFRGIDALFAVFNFTRREYTPSDVDAMEAKVDDLALDLAERKRYEDLLRKLRNGKK